MEIQEKLNQLNEKSDALKNRVDTVLDSTQPTECSIAMSPELKNEIGNLIIEYMQLEQLCEKECGERFKTLNAVKTDYENAKTQKKQVTQSKKIVTHMLSILKSGMIDIRTQQPTQN